MLSIKERQTELKALGYYTGAIDGIEGKGTKGAYLKLQKDYFVRKKDIDGLYGKNTDILLQNAYKCRNLKHFTLKEFKCQCNGLCTGYPAILDSNLLTNADTLREHLGVAMKITSGLRCAKHNSAVGGALLSRHKSGKAFDFTSTSTRAFINRKNAIDYWVSLPNARYGYCNGYGNCNGKISTPNVSTMGNATHVDVK